MEPSSSVSSSFAALDLSPSCKHVLEKFYPEIEKGKNEMDTVQKNNEGKHPYVKIGATDPEKPDKVWVGMQVIAADKKIAQIANNTFDSFYNVGNYLWNIQVTNTEYTHKALHSALGVVKEEIPKKYENWKQIEHSIDDKSAMLKDLTNLRQEIFMVSLVVSSMIDTYKDENNAMTRFNIYKESDAKNIELINAENEDLTNFASYLEAKINDLQDILEKENVIVDESPPERVVTQKKTVAQDVIKFETEEQANKWYITQFERAVNTSNQYKDQTKNYKDFKVTKGYGSDLFNEFANNVDVAFLKNNKKSKDYAIEVSAKMLEQGVSNNLAPLLKEATSFSYIIKVIGEKGTESDFRLFFEVLLNKNQTGPADLDNAPIVLNEILKSLAFFNLYKA